MDDKKNFKVNDISENNDEGLCEVFHPHDDSIKNAKMHLLSEREYSDLSEFFKLFGNPTRLKIISLLSYGDLCVCDICESLDMNQNTVSNQLRILRSRNIVKYENASGNTQKRPAGPVFLCSREFNYRIVQEAHQAAFFRGTSPSSSFVPHTALMMAGNRAIT